MAKAIISLSFCLLFATVSACASPLSTSPPVVTGLLLDSFAPQGQDLTQDSRVQVHVNQLSSGTEQVNVFDRSGKLLFAALVSKTGGSAQVLQGFGALAGSVSVGYAPNTDGLKAGTTPPPGATVGPGGTCPCSAQLIYADAYVEIIAVFDMNGNMINSYMVMRMVQK
jgi:hypothetical protein